MIRIVFHRPVAAIALCLVILSGLTAAHAQVPGIKKPATTTDKAAQPRDPLGRDTPRGLVGGFVDALARKDYKRAAHYLDLNDLPASKRVQEGPVLARKLQKLLDRQGRFLPFGELSNDAGGLIDDGLDPAIERIGMITLKNETVPVLATQVEQDGKQKGKPPIWLISSKTMSLVPSLAASVGQSFVNDMLPPSLRKNSVFGVPLGHWLALVVFALLAFVVVVTPTSLLLRLLAGLPETSRQKRWIMLVRAAAKPAALLVGVVLFMSMATFAGVSIVARSYAGRLSEIVAWISLAWLIWRTIDGIADITIRRMARRERSAGLSAVVLFRRATKTLVVFIVVLAALETIGVDMTTGIAALGIGGLALALGAQKTIENFVGSLTLVIDQPVRVGDFCRFGTVLGTVEDIGMRSTRIRTLDRTLVTVPNGEFSSLQIENYALRDSFLVSQSLGLRYDTAQECLQTVLEGLRRVLDDDPRVDPDPARIRFTGFGADRLNIEIFAYVYARDWDAFLKVREELNFRIMAVVREAGAEFAFPSRTLYLEGAPPATQDENSVISEN